MVVRNEERVLMHDFRHIALHDTSITSCTLNTYNNMPIVDYPFLSYLISYIREYVL